MALAQAVSVLLVDDQPRNVVALKAALAGVDCQIVIAHSGTEALKRALAQDFAVILLDVQMPDMDGFETASLIHARIRSQSTPIIFLTADDRVGPRVREGYRLGAVDYMHKPLDPRILRAKVAVFVELFRKTAALEQRTAELMTTTAELKRSEEHFRALIENAFDLILIVQENGTIRYASPSVERILGYPPEQLSGQRMAALVHAEDLATLRSDIALFLQTDGASPSTSRRWRHADGSYRVLESTATNLLGTPSVAGIVVHARDVTERNRAEDQVRALNGELERRVTERTHELEIAIADLEREASERKRAEDTLEETEHRLRTVVNNTPIVLFAVDHLGIFTLFEGRALRSIGMEPGQIVGQPALVTTPQVSTSSGATGLILTRDVERALGGESFTAVVEAFGRVFELKYTPNLDSDGALVGAIGIAVDISERRALDERKDAFIATVSHELRTPLNGIIAISQLLMGSALDAPQQEYADIIHRSGQALHRLIDDVLTLARYQSGKVSIDDVDLDLRLALEDVTALLVGPARAKGLDIVAHVAHDVPRGLRGDAGRLRQVLLNLAGNALKFTDTGSVLLRAAVDHSQGNRVSVRFEVHDTGVGIAPAVQARLFQPFERADMSTTTRYGGTGLGLAICRQLVESMGGEIGLDSAPGSGSTFWFVLSLARDERMDLVGRANLSGLRVLLTCDVPVRAAALNELVRSWSMLGTASASAAETTTIFDAARVAGNPFDAVVVALEDAAGAGASLARSLSEQTDGVGRHVILVAPMDELAAISGDMAGVPIISSPVRSSQLFDALAQLFGADTSHRDGVALFGLDVADSAPGSGEKILVVDDAPMNQLVARRALEHLGYQAVVAEGGRAALRLEAETDFAVVLMDCRMPEMDGFETTRRIRQREAASGVRRVPIVALTANAQESDRDSCLAAGMDDYLSKPLDLDDLARILRRWTIEMRIAPSGIAHSVEPTQIVHTDGPPWSQYVLDPGALDAIREVQVPGEPDLFAEMADAFLADARTQLVQLTSALARGDAEDLANVAHSLKSGAGYLGARELHRLCVELESLGRSGVTEGGQVLAHELQTAFEYTRRALTEEVMRHVDAAA